MDKKSDDQEERLDYLIGKLCEEPAHYRDIQVMQMGGYDKRRFLRSLMNVRMPGPVSEEFLQVQDAFLLEEARKKGIVVLEQIPSVREQYCSDKPYADRISIWQGDITRLSVDAIVNAANSQMLGCFVPCHSCIDNAIHWAAGIQLREECARIMRQKGHEEPAGQAVITKAYNLPCKYVIHTVGPVVGKKLTGQDCELLKSCYTSCLETAEREGVRSIAFCCISTGEFHFPNDKAASLAVETVGRFLGHSSIRRVVFNVYKDEDLRLYERIFKS